MRKLEVPEDAPIEHQELCKLYNSNLNPRELLKASISMYQLLMEMELRDHQPLKVQEGLFKGTVLYPKSMASRLVPKVQGTYEKEVQLIIEEYSSDFETFIEIGCAEGFYVGGIATCLRKKSIGVDIDPESEVAIDYIRSANNVGSLLSYEKSINDACMMAAGPTMVLIDVDGGELHVMEEVNTQLGKNEIIGEAFIIVESDFDLLTGQINTDQIITALSSWGWSCIKTTEQDVRLRFTESNRYLPFLTQVARGIEGRAGAQNWVSARKLFA
jgi:hypothetical protein